MKTAVISVAVIVKVPDHVDLESLVLHIPPGVKIGHIRPGAFVHEPLPEAEVLSYESETVAELED